MDLDQIRTIKKDKNPASKFHRFIIAGDVSATNVLLGIYGQDEETHLITKIHYQGREITDFKRVIDDLLKQSNVSPDQVNRMVLAPAGLIIDQTCEMTNAPFSLDASQFSFPTKLINDFAAIGWYIGNVPQIDSLELRAGQAQQGENIAVIGAGTGLGISLVAYNKALGLYEPHPSEWGTQHTKLESSLEKWLESKGIEPNLNNTLTGRGIANLYQFVLDQKELTDQNFERATDKAAYIATKALKDSEHPANQAMSIFWENYGREICNLAHAWAATGGLCIAGGIIRENIHDEQGKIRRKIQEQINTSYDRHNTMPWASNIPISAIIDPEVGLKGALLVVANPRTFDYI